MLPELSSNSSISTDMIISECEIYCALERRCWGCLKVCNVTCQWIAVTNCDKRTREKHSIKQNLSQKTGKIITKCLLTNH